MLTADSKELAIRIENSGKAISAELMTHLFEPFASRDGTGLGLWVTYQIVSQLRGDIRARNIVSGACFEVSLPFTQELPA
jgi:signal transduction histidine kinase